MSVKYRIMHWLREDNVVGYSIQTLGVNGEIQDVTNDDNGHLLFNTREDAEKYLGDMT